MIFGFVSRMPNQNRNTRIRLADFTVSMATRLKYQEALQGLTDWMGSAENDFCNEDDLICAFVQYLYEEMRPKNAGLLVVAAVQDKYPGVALVRAKRLLGAWEKLEPPARAFPLPAVGCCLIIVNWLESSLDEKSKLQLACTALLLFTCLMRPHEVRRIKKSDFSRFSRGFTLALSPEQSKTGKRHNRMEIVSITDPVTVFFLDLLFASLNSDDLLSPWSTAHGFASFVERVSDDFPFIPRITPYSFKRGGATHLFSIFRSYDPIVQLGRWSSVNSARLYIDDAFGALGRMRLSPRETAKCERARQFLADLVRLNGGVGRGADESFLLKNP